MRDLALRRLNVRALISSFVALAGVLALGTMVVELPTVAVAATLIILALVIVAKTPTMLFYGLLVLAFSSVPDFVPTGFGMGGIQFRFYEPVLIVAAIFAAVKYRGPEHRVPGAVALASVLVCGVVLGLASANPDVRVMTDVRPLVNFFLAFFIAAKLVRAGKTENILNVVAGILWLSATTTIAASIIGFNVANMQSEAAGSTDTAARLIGPATYLASAVLCGLLALYIVGRIHLRDYWVYWLPAIPLVTLTFSRNILIAVVVAIVFGVVANFTVPSVARAGRLVLSAVALALVLYAVTSVLSGIAVADWLRSQLDGYLDRVIGGIGTDAIAEDGSAQFRVQQENAYLIPEINESPFLGHGFGYAYKPLNTGRSISDKSEYLRYYAHNFYLWTLVKVGFVGLLLIFVPIMVSVTRAARTKASVALAAGAVTVGFMGISVVAPMPLGNPTSVVFGAVAGICAAYASSSRKPSGPPRPIDIQPRAFGKNHRPESSEPNIEKVGVY